MNATGIAPRCERPAPKEGGMTNGLLQSSHLLFQEGNGCFGGCFSRLDRFSSGVVQALVGIFSDDPVHLPHFHRGLGNELPIFSVRQRLSKQSFVSVPSTVGNLNFGVPIDPVIEGVPVELLSYLEVCKNQSDGRDQFALLRPCFLSGASVFEPGGSSNGGYGSDNNTDQAVCPLVHNANLSLPVRGEGEPRESAGVPPLAHDCSIPPPVGAVEKRGLGGLEHNPPKPDCGHKGPSTGPEVRSGIFDWGLNEPL